MVAERGGSCSSNQMYKELEAMKKSDQENMRRVEGSLGSKMARAERREKPGLDNSEVRIMLLGEKAAGKKAVCNTILGRTEFKFQDTFQTNIKKETAQILGKTISVIKTPSCSNTDHYRVVIRQCLLLFSPGPHVFLLVIKIHNTPQNKTEISLIMEELQKIFGPGVENYVMILFNNDGKLLSKSIEEYIQQVGKELEQLVQKCGRRYHVINKNINDRTQVIELLEKIDSMVQQNEGYYGVENRLKESEIKSKNCSIQLNLAG
ncbi:UNVERIFIED_CONTAM: hypothetical protein FKN15_034083 [Acipenser sinensis]